METARPRAVIFLPLTAAGEKITASSAKTETDTSRNPFSRAILRKLFLQR